MMGPVPNVTRELTGHLNYNSKVCFYCWSSKASHSISLLSLFEKSAIGNNQFCSLMHQLTLCRERLIRLSNLKCEKSSVLFSSLQLTIEHLCSRAANLLPISKRLSDLQAFCLRHPTPIFEVYHKTIDRLAIKVYLTFVYFFDFFIC